MNKADYLCRLIRHAANVPVERIQLNEFVPTREGAQQKGALACCIGEKRGAHSGACICGAFACHQHDQNTLYRAAHAGAGRGHPDRSVPLLGAGAPACEEYPARSGVLGRPEHGYPGVLQLGRKGR